MTVVRKCMIAIPTLSDWLKNLAAVFQPMRGKTKTNRSLCVHFFSRALGKLRVIATNSDWLIALFGPVVIFWEYFLWNWYYLLHWNRLPVIVLSQSRYYHDFALVLHH